ncbi:MAG: O-antigen ligase domain-containing protein [Sphingobacteriia bacterium]|nr:MAG: O-antigen ligase domain-containing protein [Sphingobacteriia bacterium]
MKNEIQIPAANVSPRKFLFSKGAWSNFFLKKKLAGFGGFFFLLACSLFFSFAISKYGFIPGVLFLAIIAGLPFIYGVTVYPKFGILVFIFLANLIMWILRMGLNFPLGTLMDAMEVFLILGFFIQQKQKSDWSFIKGPIPLVIIIWIIFNLLEVINPAAESRLAWVYTIRSVAVIMLMYFIFVYNIRTKDFIKIILKLWLTMSIFGALYGLKQQFFGFAGFEERFVHSDPNLEQLLFIGGQWRRFSIYSDPVAFSYNMVNCSLLCIGLMTGPLKTYKRVVLGICAIICLWAMLYSGTRGAFALPPVVMILLVILKFNKQIMTAAIIGAIGMIVLIFMPTSNPTIYRFQTAFKPSDDASFNVRKINQKRIQPYIQSHPIGGGLGSTGIWGQRFAPNSFLANFPPDSGYVRVAVELGWLGLFIFCCFMFTILRVGIINYFAIKDPELKSYCLAMLLIAFSLHIGNYPQEAIVQLPSSVYFYLVTALIVVTRRIDDEQQLQLKSKII